MGSEGSHSPREPRGTRERGAAAALALILAAVSVAPGCLLRDRAGARPHLGGPAMEASPRSEAPAAVPDFAPALVGKPYRDLRRHTAQPLGEVSGIDVSPDGATLLYASTQDGPTPNLYLKPERSGGVVRKTMGPSWDIHPKFSPDGRWIAYASNRDGNFDIWIIPAQGSAGAEQATSSGDDEVHPAWSPDGKQIAFSRLSKRHGWTLWILDREAQTAVELGAGLFPDWSPTGDWIAFQKPSDRPPHWFGLWLIRPDGSEVRQAVAGDGFGAVEPTWAPEGNLIAFAAVRRTSGDARRSPAGGIWVLEVEGGKLYRLTGDPESDAAPAWGLGGRIYFTSDRLGSQAIWSLIPPEVN